MRCGPPRSAAAAALLAALVLLAGCGADGDARPAVADGAPASLPATAPAPADAPARRTAAAVPPAARPGARRRAAPPADLGAWVRRPTVLRAAPRGPAVARLGPRTRFDGPQVLGVVARRPGWLGVLHDALPNGATGWIRAADAQLVREPWSVEIDLSARRALVRLHGRAVDRFTVAVGRPASPTPTGRFSITDRIRPAPGSPYGCCALALSGRQPNVPQGWAGGDRIAIHGTTDAASLGRAASLGCVRVGDRDLRRLFRRLPVGARVTISA
jgi:hypothetical protein